MDEISDLVNPPGVSRVKGLVKDVYNKEFGSVSAFRPSGCSGEDLQAQK